MTRDEMIRNLARVVEHLDGGEIRDDLAIYTVRFVPGPAGVITADLLRSLLAELVKGTQIGHGPREKMTTIWGPPPIAEQVQATCARFCASVAPYLFRSAKVGDVRCYDFTVNSGKALVWFGEHWLDPDAIAGSWAEIVLPPRTAPKETP